jgi:5-(carboxyamino)imidazole ribonucleotide synthase
MQLQPGSTIGILGGGQLGRMLALAAAPLGFKVVIYDPMPESPAFEVSSAHVCAAWDDSEALARFAGLCDVITLEFENVPVATVRALAASKPVLPGAKALQVSQDRLAEKQFLENLGLRVAPFAAVSGLGELEAAHAALGPEAILKTRRMGYDGKGQVRLAADSNLAAAIADIGSAPAVLEGFVDFISETSLIITRAQDGSTAFWDCPRNQHRDGILRRSSLPGPLSAAQTTEAARIGAMIGDALDYVGVLTVEFFVASDGGLIINEIAPRVHNSGHWTIEHARTSQFANHIRAIAGWPLAATDTRAPNIEMINLIGDEAVSIQYLIEDRNAAVHLYGKHEVRPGRKMGHVTRRIETNNT